MPSNAGKSHAAPWLQQWQCDLRGSYLNTDTVGSILPTLPMLVKRQGGRGQGAGGQQSAYANDVGQGAGWQCLKLY